MLMAATANTAMAAPLQQSEPEQGLTCQSASILAILAPPCWDDQTTIGNMGLAVIFGFGLFLVLTNISKRLDLFFTTVKWDTHGRWWRTGIGASMMVIGSSTGGWLTIFTTLAAIFTAWWNTREWLWTEIAVRLNTQFPGGTPLPLVGWPVDWSWIGGFILVCLAMVGYPVVGYFLITFFSGLIMGWVGSAVEARHGDGAADNEGEDEEEDEGESDKKKKGESEGDKKKPEGEGQGDKKKGESEGDKKKKKAGGGVMGRVGGAVKGLLPTKSDKK
jgi:hypothetical protein